MSIFGSATTWRARQAVTARDITRAVERLEAGAYRLCDEANV
jgi:RNA polymerase-binding transcription factor DksA